MSVFIYDSTLTLFKRILNREKIWEAHSNHSYQKFAKIYGHKKVITAIIAVNFLLFIPGYLTLKFSEYDLYFCLLTYFTLGCVIFFLEKKYIMKLQ